MISKVLTTLTSGHHLGEGSRSQVPATDSQQGLQNGVDLQVVEVLVPGKHFNQTSFMRQYIDKKRKKEKTVVRVFFIPMDP